MTNKLIDIGVNLTSKQFRHDLADVIGRARAAGVVHMVVTGLSAPLSLDAALLASRYRGTLSSTAGIHPHNVARASRTAFEEVRAIASRDEVVAVGEMGLDYNRNFSPRTIQRSAFAKQLAIAAETGKPVFLHERDAHDDFVAIMREHRSSISGGVVHCFTSSRGALDVYLELDLHIGITGYICDDRRGRHLRALASAIPRDRLMVETDAPFLLPRDLATRHARRNEPVHLHHVAAAVARARGETLETLAAQTSANARGLFGLGEPAQLGGDVISPSGSVTSTDGSVRSP